MKNITRDAIIAVLKECYDPEIPIDLWNLGLIYKIENNDKEIKIIMSLTTPGCTMGKYMADDIKAKLKKISEARIINVEVTFEPPWEPKMMTAEGRKKMGFEPSNITNDNKEWE
jgi:metal-sulfur cluster biosynthetic enzyme|tara:strand:+ start:1398 stop:1739 length:342 start_codon:yes stop_codon:yes gene_type:complete